MFTHQSISENLIISVSWSSYSQLIQVRNIMCSLFKTFTSNCNNVKYKALDNPILFSSLSQDLSSVVLRFSPHKIIFKPHGELYMESSILKGSAQQHPFPWISNLYFLYYKWIILLQVC